MIAGALGHELMHRAAPSLPLHPPGVEDDLVADNDATSIGRAIWNVLFTPDLRVVRSPSLTVDVNDGSAEPQRVVAVENEVATATALALAGMEPDYAYWSEDPAASPRVRDDDLARHTEFDVSYRFEAVDTGAVHTETGTIVTGALPGGPVEANPQVSVPTSFFLFGNTSILMDVEIDPANDLNEYVRSNNTADWLVDIRTDLAIRQVAASATGIVVTTTTVPDPSGGPAIPVTRVAYDVVVQNLHPRMAAFPSQLWLRAPASVFG